MPGRVLETGCVAPQSKLQQGSRGTFTNGSKGTKPPDFWSNLVQNPCF